MKKPKVKLFSRNHPDYTFTTQRSNLNWQSPFSIHVGIRKNNHTLVCLDIGEILPFHNGLLCQLISIDNFSYNGRTAIIQVQCIAHIAS